MHFSQVFAPPAKKTQNRPDLKSKQLNLPDL